MIGYPDHGSFARDYAELRPSPKRMIGDDGEYIPGWFESFDGEINPSASRARLAPFQSWLHVQFVTPELLVVANVANLGLGGNVALLVVDRASGRVVHEASTPLLWQNRISSTDGYRVFGDPDTGSRLALDEGLSQLFVDVNVGGMRLHGTARAIFDRPLIQTTAYGKGRGTLQWWGCVEVEQMSLEFEGRVYALPSGSMGLYDRTVGHRRRRQNWNWLAAIGETETGERFAFQASQDRPRALPYRWIHKAGIWMGGRLQKASPGARFQYDPAEATSQEWKILLKGRHGARHFSSHLLYRQERKRIPGVLRAFPAVLWKPARRSPACRVNELCE